MAKPDVIAGLDMGSGRVTCLVGSPEPDSERMRVLGGASIPCRGINGGVVVNIQETKSAVGHALEEAEAAAGVTVSGVFLGVRGTHLQSFNNKGAFPISRTDKEITAEDVHSVVANAKAIPLSSDREILHVVPQSFSIDRQRGVPNPVGMEGSLLEVDVHIVTASSAHLNNVVKAVTQGGFEVQELIYGLLATGEQLVTPEEKELGSLLVDLGGQTLSLAAYSEGSIRYSKEIGIGADFITRDLAVGLKTSMATAERLKIAHGIAHSSLLNGDLEIEFNRVDGRTLDKIKTSTMIQYILPRVEEIFAIVAEDLQNSSYADLISPGGVVLTGGGAKLPGITELAKNTLKLSAQIGCASTEEWAGDGFMEALEDPEFATVLGLVLSGAVKEGWLGREKESSWSMRRLLKYFQP